MLDQARDAIVRAVQVGDLPLERLTDAAARVRSLAVPGQAQGDRAAQPGAASLAAAAALEIAGPLPQLTMDTLVLRCDEAGSLAVGTVPWGLSTAGASVVELSLRRGDPPPLSEIRSARAVVLLTRDRHRHNWMARLAADVRALRPDAVLVEMGSSPMDDITPPAIASHGASVANARAVAAALGLTGSPQS
jgi:beta-N-acetylhexosaminidase